MALPPPLPAFRLEEAGPAVHLQGSFLAIERLKLRLQSANFEYDVVTRRALDSVTIVAHFERDGVPHVMLVSALRVPLWLRHQNEAMLWELPAGLVEPGESPREAAARELFEETGAKLPADALVPLGPPLLPCPGMVAEVQSYFHAVIDPAALAQPTGDASVLERISQRCVLPLEEALALCASGALPDLKTELGLRRLKELWESP